jgi:hypothetical protein
MHWNVTGDRWVLGMCEVRNGKAYFAHGKDMLLCPKNFAFFWPANSLSKSEDKDAEVTVTFHIYRGLEANQKLPEQPRLFIPPNWSLPAKAEQISEYLRQGTKPLNINGIKSASFTVERAKHFVDENFRGLAEKTLNIPELAYKLKTNPAALSRDFKAASGISLVEYHELLMALTQAEAKWPSPGTSPTSTYSKIELKATNLSLLAAN